MDPEEKGRESRKGEYVRGTTEKTQEGWLGWGGDGGRGRIGTWSGRGGEIGWFVGERTVSRDRGGTVQQRPEPFEGGLGYTVDVYVCVGQEVY